MALVPLATKGNYFHVYDFRVKPGTATSSLSYSINSTTATTTRFTARRHRSKTACCAATPATPTISI